MLCIIVEKENDVSAFKDYKPEDGAAKPEAPKQKAPAQESQPAPASSPSQQQQVSTPSSPLPQQQQAPTGDRLKVTPYAKKLASEKGVNLQALQGSGPGGRIIASDISGGAPAQQAQQPGAQVTGAAPQGKITSSHGQFEDIQLTNMRKTIAKRLTESKSTIPHYYLTSEIVVDDLLK